MESNSREGFTLNMLNKVEESLNTRPPFYDSLVLYVKQRGWSSLVKYRAESFWLESDFIHQE
jgi:hypothetical protein